MKKRTTLKISIAFWSAVLLAVLAVWTFYDSNSSPWSFGSHYRRVHFEPDGPGLCCEYISEPSGWIQPVVGSMYSSPRSLMYDALSQRSIKKGHFLGNSYAYASFPDSFAFRHHLKQVPHYTVYVLTIPYWEPLAFCALMLIWSVISLRRVRGRLATQKQGVAEVTSL